jgi:hypothetical protein
MMPVITPSRRKLCGRSAIGSSDDRLRSLRKKYATSGYIQASPKLLEHRDLAPFSPFEAQLLDLSGNHVITLTGS